MLCSVSESVLLIIDTQTRLAAATPEAARARVINSSGVLLQAAALLNVPALVTEQYPKGLGHTEPAVIRHLPAQARHFEKTCFSCCAAAGFMDALRGLARRQIILAGMETHVCVLQTALELNAAGKQVFVAEDAVCSRVEAHHLNALARLRQAGVIVSNSESVLFEWLRDAGHARFKQISALIR
jgi:nicotinamidase-related amidase